MAIIYDMLELNGLPANGDVLGVPGSGADVEFLMSETTATVVDDYYSSGLGEFLDAGFRVGSNGTWPADIDGTSYQTPNLYDVSYTLEGTSYDGFIVEAEPVGGGALRYFFIPEDGISPVDINTITITSMTSVSFVDADNAATDDTVNFVVCFAAGTRIATPQGQRRVEELTEGDLVTTLDYGDLPVLWRAQTQVSRDEQEADTRLRAVEVAPGAFAEGLPGRRLRVSRQHRLLVRSRIAERMFGAAEVLVAAKDLLDWPGVRLGGTEEVLFFVHLLLPCHAVLLAEGLGAESLWIGEEAVRMLGAEAVCQAQQRLYAPQVPARPMVKGRRARQLVSRHRRNGRNLWEATLERPRVHN